MSCGKNVTLGYRLYVDILNSIATFPQLEDQNSSPNYIFYIPFGTVVVYSSRSWIVLWSVVV